MAVLKTNRLGSGNSHGRKNKTYENSIGMPNSRDSPPNMRWTNGHLQCRGRCIQTDMSETTLSL